MSFLKSQVTFPSNFVSIFNAIRLSSSPLSSKIIYFGQRGQLRSHFFRFRVLELEFAKFLKLLLKLKVSSSSNFVLFLIAMTNNSSVSMKVIPFLLWIKISCQSPNFDTFKRSGESLPNFSCYFSNHKSVFLQNLRNSSVSWKLTLL